ncbi:MAG TPA: hypothetical protein VE987_17525 [Polyangiaceae bacterium]|nr:hypothetical protein [Polyangiaceae bacterium]
MKAIAVPLVVGLGIVAPAALAAGPTKQECVTANETAQDLRRAGKLHEARADLATCLATTCPRPLREDCAARLAEVEAAMPTVVFVVKDAASNDLSDVRVTLDGKPLLDKLDGAAVPIDPGEHRFEFDAEGFGKIGTTVVLHEGDKKRRVMVFLDATTAAQPQAAPAQPPPASPAPPPAAPATSGDSGARTQRAVALALGGAGAAAIVAGGVLGILAKVTYDHAASECSGGICSLQGHGDQQSAFGQATAADVAFIAGGALLAAGAVVYFTAPAKAAPVVGVGPTWTRGGAGIGLKGSW